MLSSKFFILIKKINNKKPRIISGSVILKQIYDPNNSEIDQFSEDLELIQGSPGSPQRCEGESIYYPGHVIERKNSEDNNFLFDLSNRSQVNL